MGVLVALIGARRQEQSGGNGVAEQSWSDASSPPPRFSFTAAEEEVEHAAAGAHILPHHS
jgi:hypothetical protein